MQIAFNEFMGDRLVSYQDVCEVDLPEKTSTYTPLPNKLFVGMVKKVMEEKLPEWEIKKENYVLARKGQRMFATIMFTNPNYIMPMCWALGNSYDKSMSARFASGIQVGCCSNTSLSGSDMVFMRKHTPNLIPDVSGELEGAAGTAVDRLEKRIEEMLMLKRIEVTMDRGFEVLGLLRGYNVLGSTEFSAAIDHWKEPPFKEFEPRNAWSLLNSGTWALHKSPPHRAFEKRRDFHKNIIDMFPSRENDCESSFTHELA